MTSHDSITVTAKLTPEEAEEGKINDLYQRIYTVEQKGECETAIERYKSEVIPLAARSQFKFVVQPRLAGHGPTLFAGLSKRVDLRLVSRLECGSGAVAMRYEPRR